MQNDPPITQIYNLLQEINGILQDTSEISTKKAEKILNDWLCEKDIKKAVCVKSLDDNTNYRIRRNGWSLLHLAAYEDYAEVCQFLIKNFSIPVDLEEERDCRTALSVAAKRGNLDTCKVLVANNAKIDHMSKSDQSQDLRNMTALTRACSAGYGGKIDKRRTEVIDYLISQGADPRYMAMSKGIWNNGVPYHTVVHLLIVSASHSSYTKEDRDCVMKAIDSVMNSKHFQTSDAKKEFLKKKTKYKSASGAILELSALGLLCHFDHPNQDRKNASEFWDPIKDTICNYDVWIEDECGIQKKLRKGNIEKFAKYFLFWGPLSACHTILSFVLSFEFVSKSIENRYVDLKSEKVIFLTSCILALLVFALVYKIQPEYEVVSLEKSAECLSV